MKDSLATISQGPLNQFAVETAGRNCKSHLSQARNNFVCLLRENFLDGLATLGTGIVFFIGITLFLLQLAEHG